MLRKGLQSKNPFQMQSTTTRKRISFHVFQVVIDFLWIFSIGFWVSPETQRGHLPMVGVGVTVALLLLLLALWRRFSGGSKPQVLVLHLSSETSDKARRGEPASGEVSFAGKINEVYTLVNVYIAMENHHFNGKTHYKWPFSIAMLVYQRVDGGFVNCHCREPKFAEIWSFLEAGSHLNCTLWL